MRKRVRRWLTDSAQALFHQGTDSLERGMDLFFKGESPRGVMMQSLRRGGVLRKK